MSVTSFGVDLRKWETAIDLRIGRRFVNFKMDIDLRIWKKDTFEVHMSVI